jgi:hypothetical protein
VFEGVGHDGSQNYAVRLAVKRGLRDVFAPELVKLEARWQELKASTTTAELDVAFREAIRLEMSLVRALAQPVQKPALVEPEAVSPKAVDSKAGDMVQDVQVKRSLWDRVSSLSSLGGKGSCKEV